LCRKRHRSQPMSLKSLAQMLPEPIKMRLKAARDYGSLALVRLCSSNGLLASLYYCLFSRELYREHRAVLQGRWQYDKLRRRRGGNSALLRRNVRRLGKGLRMRPRRDTFAEDYIGETVHCHAGAARRDIRAGRRRRAGDVRGAYFSALASTPRIEA